MPKDKDFPLLDPDFVGEIVGLVNSGAKIIQIRSHERVRDLALGLLLHPKAMHELKKARPLSPLMSEKIKVLGD